MQGAPNGYPLDPQEPIVEVKVGASKEVRKTRVLAAIPAFNEEVAIGTVVLRTRPYVDEVLVVDDGSHDRTAEVARLARGLILRNPSNRGKGAAIQIALDHARARGFDAMVLLDGDGQHDPGDIPGLLEPILHGEADVVVGVRRRSTSQIPRYRRFGQRLLDYLTAAGGGGAVTDSQCGFRALSRTAIEALNLEQREFGVESEMLIEAREKQLRIEEVPIKVRYDVDGSTKGPLPHGLGVVDALLRIISFRHPVLFFTLPGVILFIVGLWYGLETMAAYNLTRSFYTGKALLAIVCLFLGALATFVGLMLNAMTRLLRRRGI